MTCQEKKSHVRLCWPSRKRSSTSNNRSTSRLAYRRSGKNGEASDGVCKLQSSIPPKPLTSIGLYMFFICVMWGYEGLAGAAVIGLGAFRAQYGHPYEGDYVVDANWQLAFTASTLAGMLLLLFPIYPSNPRSLADFKLPRTGHRWCYYRCYGKEMGQAIVRLCSLFDQHRRCFRSIFCQYTCRILCGKASEWNCSGMFHYCRPNLCV